jgi:hypothetical protein
MNQLTIRGFDAELEQRLRALARREGVSLNQAALRLMRRGAGLERTEAAQGAVGDTLEAFFGGWTEAEAEAFTAAVAVFEQVDEEMWA